MDIKELIKASSVGFKRHPWEITRLKMLDFFIRKTVSAHPSEMLDVGSGDAYLASGIAMKNGGANIYAADINYSGEILKIISENKPVNLFFQNSINAVPDQIPLNAVLMMDVLEHIEKPDTLLKPVMNMPSVSSNTVFIITVPAYQKLFSAHDISLGHFKRYNLKELKSLLVSSKLKILYSGYVFSSLLPIRCLQVLAERRTKRINNAGVNQWKGGRIVTGLITTFLWLEFKISWYLALAGIKLPGLSCYCICQPSRL